jgi:hypothetical protein
MSRMVIRTLHKQIDQSIQNKNTNGIDTLITMLIDIIIREVGFDS